VAKIYVQQGFLYGDGITRNATMPEQTLGLEIDKLHALLEIAVTAIRTKHTPPEDWLERAQSALKRP